MLSPCKENWLWIREEKGRDRRADRAQDKRNGKMRWKKGCAERELLCLSDYITFLQKRALGLCVCVLVLMWALFVGSFCVCVYVGVTEFAKRKMPTCLLSSPVLVVWPALPSCHRPLFVCCVFMCGCWHIHQCVCNCVLIVQLCSNVHCYKVFQCWCVHLCHKAPQWFWRQLLEARSCKISVRLW